MAALVARRGVLQAGAVTGGLALAGLSPQSAAAVPGRPTPITGSIAGHVRLDPIKGGTIRLIERDGAGRQIRDLAYLDVPVAGLYPQGRPVGGAAPLPAICKRAQDLALRVAAADWQVPPETCRVAGWKIIHAPTGRSVGYTAWVDVA